MPSRRPPVLVRVLVVAGALGGLGYLIYARTRPEPAAAAATGPETKPTTSPSTGSAASATSAGSAHSPEPTPPRDRHFYGSKYLGNAR